jgi:DNA-binding transcriptional LysR family regulator
MEMHQVRYFLSMARSLNFTRAADECNVTQPSLTRAIQKLEEELGGALFRRERSRTHLTDLGRLMLPHLERTFEAAEAAKQLARGVGKAQVTPLALGVASSIDSDTLEAVLAELAAGLPGFALSVTSASSAEIIEGALSGALDLVIVELPDDRPDRLEAWPLFDQLYHLVTRADHHLAGGASARLADARDEPFIDWGGDAVERLQTAASAVGFEPSIPHRAADPAQIRRLILAGLGSALMPPPRDCGESSRLRALRLEDVEVLRSVVLSAISGRRRSIAADAFVRASRARDWNAASACQ